MLANVSGPMEKNGVAIVPSALGAREVARLKDWLENAALRRSRAGARHILSESTVNALANDPRLTELAAATLGGEARAFRATLFDKSPTANWLVMWHQDTALPLREKHDTPGWGPWSLKEGILYAHAPASALEEIVAIRVHLDDSTSLNGPLRVLPGTHTLGVLDDDRIQDFAVEIEPQECTVGAGGVIVMRPLVVHASSKSQSESPRRVLHLEYASNSLLADGMELAIA